MTVSNITHGIFGSKKIAFCDIAFDSSYPTGGEGLTPGNVGLERIEFTIIPNKSGYMFEYDYTNKKLKALTPRSAQVAVTTDKITIVASGAAHITDGQSCTVAADFRSAVDAAAGAEVAPGTNLSAVTSVKAMFIGS